LNKWDKIGRSEQVGCEEAPFLSERDVSWGGRTASGGEEVPGASSIAQRWDKASFLLLLPAALIRVKY